MNMVLPLHCSAGLLSLCRPCRKLHSIQVLLDPGLHDGEVTSPDPRDPLPRDRADQHPGVLAEHAIETDICNLANREKRFVPVRHLARDLIGGAAPGSPHDTSPFPTNGDGLPIGDPVFHSLHVLPRGQHADAAADAQQRYRFTCPRVGRDLDLGPL